MATSTPAAIRDRALTVIESLTPASDAGVKFLRSQSLGVGAFMEWAEANPSACRRRIQIRTEGSTETPAVSNHDVEEHQVTLTVLVAYPQTQRDGRAAALDRDDTLDEDAFQIDKAIGMLGKANFTPPYADATWISGSPPARIEGNGVDFLELRYVYIYKRTR